MMRQDDRRRELGKMLMDVAKYLATVGLIGGILTDNLSLIGGLYLASIVGLLLLLAFYIIPPKRGE